MKKIVVLWGNPPKPVFMLWRKAMSQSTEGLFLLFIVTSVLVNSVRNSALTYSWIDILLVVITILQIKRYYKRHKQLYLSVYQNKVQHIKRYLDTPELIPNSRGNKIKSYGCRSSRKGTASWICGQFGYRQLQTA